MHLRKRLLITALVLGVGIGTAGCYVSDAEFNEFKEDLSERGLFNEARLDSLIIAVKDVYHYKDNWCYTILDGERTGCDRHTTPPDTAEDNPNYP